MKGISKRTLTKFGIYLLIIFLVVLFFFSSSLDISHFNKNDERNLCLASGFYSQTANME
ncbi:hypothetical protein ES703_50302 [subsurface metagenome]